MRKHRLNQRRVAAICAAILITLSTVTILRERGVFERANSSDTTSHTSEVTSDDSPTVHEQSEDTSIQTPIATNQSTSSVSAFTYTAQPGSSYTEFARQAIATYAHDKKLDLTSTQSLEAEVALANKAGAPLLEIGQIITIPKVDVAEATQIFTTRLDDSAEPTPTSTDKDTYAATVAAGDSFTLHARRAIAVHNNDTNQTLTNAQRVAAESYIVAEAGAPQLEIGQTITITSTTITHAINHARALSSTEQAAWEPWVAAVNFQ